jgi:hypothetical protein
MRGFADTRQTTMRHAEWRWEHSGATMLTASMEMTNPSGFGGP